MNTENSYGLIALIFHWSNAIIVIGLFVLGYWMVQLDYYSDWYTKGPYWHQGVGVVFALLLALRFVWKCINHKPNPLSASATLNRLVELMHYSLYALLAIIIITGYLISAADTRPIDVLGLFELPVDLILIDDQEILAGNWHRYLAYALAAAVVLHIGAALKHHFVDKDSTLRRMLG